MKAPGMGMFTNEGHSTAQVIKYVLEDRDPFSTPRYAVEEVFHSQNATKVDNKYEFSFPQSWFNGNLNNKSIGLRKIQVIRRPVIIECTFYYIGTQNTGFNRNCQLRLVIPGDWTIERILNEMQYQLNNGTNKIIEFCNIGLSYYDNKVHAEVNTPVGTTLNRVYFNRYKASPLGWKNFCKIVLGKEYGDDDTIEFTKQGDSGKIFTYEAPDNVWDRSNIFFHASFANNSTNNYLSINDEFFYKPSKIYEYNFNPINFQIWTTLDGLTPIYVEGLEFLIELCLMHNDRRVTV